MTENYLLEKMLGLPEFQITNLMHNENDILVYVEKRARPTRCPNCGFESNLTVHNSREQDIRDIDMQNKRVALVLKRRRFKCSDCKSTFFEPCDSVSSNSRMTNRFREYIANQAKVRSFTEIHKETSISIVTIRDIFIEEMRTLPRFTELETPQHIGIDEIHIQRQGKHRKQAWAVICNGDERTLIDMLEDRNKTTIISFLKRLKNPRNVWYVTMDMWQPYKEAVYLALPHAKIVIDKFHVVKMANEALDKVRKSLKEQLGKRNINLKKERFILLKRAKDLGFKEQVFRDAWFSEYPRLKEAYDIKEAFYGIYEAKTKGEALLLYQQWKNSIPADFKEFTAICDTVDNWNKEIFNYFDNRISNAFVEGINSLIRAIEKQGRGYDFEVLRAKIIYFLNHKEKRPEFKAEVFHNMLPGQFNPYRFEKEERTKDYGVAFETIIDAFNAGRL